MGAAFDEADGFVLTAAQRTTVRLGNLLCLLAHNGKPLTRGEIFQRIPEYGLAKSSDSAVKMFERDKNLLRALGVNVQSFAEQGDNKVTRYAVPESAAAASVAEFNESELVLLHAAAQVWQGEGLREEARNADLKILGMLAAQGIHGLLATQSMGVVSPVFHPLWEAIQAGVCVTFSYRVPQHELPVQRQVAPLRLVQVERRWHLLAWDLERAASRVFLLERISGQVQRLAQRVTAEMRGWARDATAELVRYGHAHPAVVAVRAGSAAARLLASRGREVEVTVGQLDAGIAALGDELLFLELPLYDVQVLARELAGFASAVRVVSPPALREAVVQVLSAVVEQHSVAATGAAGVAGAAAGAVEGQDAAAQKRFPRAPSANAPERLALLLAVVNILQLEHRVPVAEMASRLGVQPADIRAIAHLLAYVGVPDELGEPAVDASLLVDLDELAETDTLVFLGDSELEFVPAFTAGEAEALRAGLELLRGELPAERIPAVDALVSRLAPTAGETAISLVSQEGRDVSELGQLCRDACAAGKLLRFVYTDLQGRRSEREVFPLALWSDGERQFLRAYCFTRHAERNFWLAQMGNTVTVPLPYELGAEVKSWQATHRVQESGAAHSAVFANVSPLAWRRIAAFTPERFARLADGTLQVKVAAWNEHTPVRLVSAVPGEITIVRPAQARRHVAEYFAAQLAAWGEAGDSGTAAAKFFNSG